MPDPAKLAALASRLRTAASVPPTADPVRRAATDALQAASVAAARRGQTLQAHVGGDDRVVQVHLRTHGARRQSGPRVDTTFRTVLRSRLKRARTELAADARRRLLP